MDSNGVYHVLENIPIEFSHTGDSNETHLEVDADVDNEIAQTEVQENVDDEIAEIEVEEPNTEQDIVVDNNLELDKDDKRLQERGRQHYEIV